MEKNRKDVTGSGRRLVWRCSVSWPSQRSSCSRSTGHISSVSSPTCCCLPARCCTCSCTGSTAGMEEAMEAAPIVPRPISTIITETRNERPPCLRPVAVGDHQLIGLHHVCLQLHAPPDRPLLAFIWGFLGFYRRALHRDVRFPLDDLSALRLVGESLSRIGPPLPRCRAPLQHLAPLERRSTFQ